MSIVYAQTSDLALVDFNVTRFSNSLKELNASLMPEELVRKQQLIRSDIGQIKQTYELFGEWLGFLAKEQNATGFGQIYRGLPELNSSQAYHHCREEIEDWTVLLELKDFRKLDCDSNDSANWHASEKNCTIALQRFYPEEKTFESEQVLSSSSTQKQEADIVESSSQVSSLDSPKAKKLSVDELLLKAKFGDAESQYQLGMIYGAPNSLMSKPKEAFRWWMEAAYQDHRESMYRLGLAYRDGLGTEANQTQAIEWLMKAADEGHDEAESALLEMDVKIPRPFKDNWPYGFLGLGALLLAWQWQKKPKKLKEVKREIADIEFDNRIEKARKKSKMMKIFEDAGFRIVENDEKRHDLVAVRTRMLLGAPFVLSGGLGIVTQGSYEAMVTGFLIYAIYHRLKQKPEKIVVHLSA